MNPGALGLGARTSPPGATPLIYHISTARYLSTTSRSGVCQQHERISYVCQSLITLTIALHLLLPEYVTNRRTFLFCVRGWRWPGSKLQLRYICHSSVCVISAQTFFARPRALVWTVFILFSLVILRCLITSRMLANFQTASRPVLWYPFTSLRTLLTWGTTGQLWYNLLCRYKYLGKYMYLFTHYSLKISLLD